MLTDLPLNYHMQNIHDFKIFIFSIVLDGLEMWTSFNPFSSNEDLSQEDQDYENFDWSQKDQDGGGVSEYSVERALAQLEAELDSEYSRLEVLNSTKGMDGKLFYVYIQKTIF